MVSIVIDYDFYGLGFCLFRWHKALAFIAWSDISWAAGPWL